MAWARFSAWVAAALAAFFISCGEEVDRTPEKLDGTPSYEFEQEDLKLPRKRAMPSRTIAPTRFRKRSGWDASRT